MSALLLLQIIAPLAFIYGVKSKMWITDTIGFVLICSVILFLILFNFIDEWLNFHLIFINAIVIFVVIYHHYHKIRHYCEKEKNDR